MPRYLDTTPNSTTTAIKRTRDEALRRVARLESNINIFITAVRDVTFNVAEADAASWMERWKANLLSGDLS